MKKFINLTTILWMAFALIANVLLIFVPHFNLSANTQVSASVGLTCITYMCLCVLTVRHLEITMHNRLVTHTEISEQLTDVILQQTTVMSSMNDRIKNLEMQLFPMKSALNNIEQQTKPKSSTPRKKKEA